MIRPLPMTNEQARSLGNQTRTADPEEYLRLRREKWARGFEKRRRLAEQRARYRAYFVYQILE